MHRRVVLASATLLAGFALTGCGGTGHADSRDDPAQVDQVRPPQDGVCRDLIPRDVEQPSNATRTVDCHDQHTAETYAVGDLPATFRTAGYDDQRLDAFAYQTCGAKFQHFVSADDSLAMRTLLSWAWFRPSKKAWAKGARWYRCDVVGGGDHSTTYVDLPLTVHNLLRGPRPPDRWMVCVNGPSVQHAAGIPCTQRHTWRAVTTIKVGDPGDSYPGATAVAAKSRDYCSKSVGAWLGYPKTYDYGYTYFDQGEWQAGNRRSVCWARTTA